MVVVSIFANICQQYFLSISEIIGAKIICELSTRMDKEEADKGNPGGNPVRIKTSVVSPDIAR